MISDLPGIGEGAFLTIFEISKYNMGSFIQLNDIHYKETIIM